MASIFKSITTRAETYKSLEWGTYETLNATQVLQNLSCVLERHIQRNEGHRRSTRKDPTTMFHGIKAPNMSVKQYMERIHKYTRCSPCCYVMAHIYMDRYFERKGGYLTSLNVHRLLITTIMVAAKFVDGCYSNGHYARVGGVSREEMNILELELLFNLDFRLFVTTELFYSYCQQLHLLVLPHDQARGTGKK